MSRGPASYRTLIEIAKHGPPHRVTSTVRQTSTFHGPPGHAIDEAGPKPSARPNAAMGAIFDFWAQFAPGLWELIYAGRPRNVKHGRWVAPYAISIHQNHVHIAASEAAARRILAKLEAQEDDMALSDQDVERIAARTRDLILGADAHGQGVRERLHDADVQSAQARDNSEAALDILRAQTRA